jgi:tetratricopeptide (TPR) repeat protein
MSEVKNLFTQQFAKAYFNIGLIYDQRNDVQNAITNYDKAFQKMVALKEKQPPNTILPDPYSEDTFFKTSTNMAVCLQKSGQHERAIEILE